MIGSVGLVPSQCVYHGDHHDFGPEFGHYLDHNFRHWVVIVNCNPILEQRRTHGFPPASQKFSVFRSDLFCACEDKAEADFVCSKDSARIWCGSFGGRFDQFNILERSRSEEGTYDG